MPKSPSLFFVAQKELLTPYALFWIAFVGFSYILLSLFSLNYRLVLITLSQASPLAYKLSLFSSLFLGLFSAFSPLDTVLLLLNACLVGITIVLMVKSIYLLGHMKKIQFSIGGSILMGFVATGCSSCGFSLLSVVGLSTSLSLLPFHGLEIHLLALVLLIFSSIYMLIRLQDSIYCKVKHKRN